jgi:hypothetical protein
MKFDCEDLKWILGSATKAVAGNKVIKLGFLLP